MLTVNVKVQVIESRIQDFIDATIENAQNSNNEPGIARFDIIQEREYPENFMLIEVYKTPEASMAHKESSHYKKWRDSVAEMMASPRTNIKYSTVYTKDTNYEL